MAPAVDIFGASKSTRYFQLIIRVARNSEDLSDDEFGAAAHHNDLNDGTRNSSVTFSKLNLGCRAKQPTSVAAPRMKNGIVCQWTRFSPVP